MHQTDRIKLILEKINQGIASEAEILEFNQWYNSFDDSKVLLSTDSPIQNIGERVWGKIEKQIYSTPNNTIRWIKRSSAAAAAILLIAGIYFVRIQANNDTSSNVSATLVLDGEQKAIAMADRQFLDSTYYYQIAASTANSTQVNTSKGAVTKVMLPDGTKVTLNAASKLFLESGFDQGNGTERVVRLEGEGYFEVTSIPNKQFVVKTNDQAIRVLGTKFNVKSLNNNETQTTLYEGKIVLETANANFVMQPNQVVSNVEAKLEILTKDVEQTKDWRNLHFSFDQDLVENVITLLADRYNLHVNLESNIPAQRISGQLGKDLTLKQIAQVMSNLTGGNFTIEKNTLTVNFKTIN